MTHLIEFSLLLIFYKHGKPSLIISLYMSEIHTCMTHFIWKIFQKVAPFFSMLRHQNYGEYISYPTKIIVWWMFNVKIIQGYFKDVLFWVFPGRQISLKNLKNYYAW